MKNSHLLTTFSLALFANVCLAQKLSYNIELFGKRIGYTHVERISKTNGEVEYKLRSSSQAKVLFINKSSVANATIIFRNNELFTATYIVDSDDDGHIDSYTEKTADGYTQTAKGVRQIIRRSIRYGSIQLYFEEPKNVTEYYSERLGKFFKLEKIGPNEYKSEINNVTAYYRYSNGQLVELEMSKSLGSVFMKKVS